MDMATVKKQYVVYMNRSKLPKTTEIPTEVITKKKTKK